MKILLKKVALRCVRKDAFCFLDQQCILCWEIFFLGSHSVVFFLFQGNGKECWQQEGAEQRRFSGGAAECTQQSLRKGQCLCDDETDKGRHGNSLSRAMQIPEPQSQHSRSSKR